MKGFPLGVMQLSGFFKVGVNLSGWLSEFEQGLEGVAKMSWR